MLIRGFLERIDTVSATGWCCDRDDFSRHLPVEAWLDGKLLATGTADIVRTDLTKAGIGQGDHGYILRLPTELSVESVHKLEVIVRADGEHSTVLRRNMNALANMPSEPAQAPQYGIVRTRMPRCVLHIGMEKTGSTSVQAYLALNRSFFLEQGVLIPESLVPHPVGSPMNHVKLATASMDIGRDNEALRTELIGMGRRAILDHRSAVARGLADEIASDGAGCALLLLSNEHCQSSLVKPQEIERLRNFLLSFSESVRVVVYLRAQHEVAVSSHMTMLKNGLFEESVFPGGAEAGKDEATLLRYDYDALVGRWEKVFGETNVDVRLFGPDVVGDFVTYLKINTANFLPLSSRQNVGFDIAATRALVALNTAAARSGRAGNHAMRAMVIEALEATHPGHGVLPSSKQAEAFQACFHASNEALCRRRFPERKELFTLQFDHYGANAVESEPTLEEFSSTMTDVLIYLMANRTT